MQNREMSAKEYLEQLRKLKQKTSSLERELDFWRERKTNLSSCGFEQHYAISTPTEAAFAACVQKIDELEQALELRRHSTALLETEIKSIIKKMPDWQEQAVLEYRYIDCLSWQEIQQVLYLSRASTFRIHGNAVASFQQFFVKKQQKNETR